MSVSVLISIPVGRRQERKTDRQKEHEGFEKRKGGERKKERKLNIKHKKYVQNGGEYVGIKKKNKGINKKNNERETERKFKI